MANTIIPFLRFNELEWVLIRAVEDSLSLADVAKKAAIPPFKVSRVLSRLRNTIEVRFGMDLRKCGILEVAVISAKFHETLPFLRAARTLRVLGKRVYLYTAVLPMIEDSLNEWFSNFEESALVVRALERGWWRPRAAATVYNEGAVSGDLGAVKITNGNPPRICSKEIDLDEVDVLIYSFKSRWPFNSLRAIERESERYLGRRVSHQTLLRHFKNHVMKLWTGNEIYLYASAEEMPYRMLYLEGRDAPGVARALLQLPWFHTAYIDIGKALVSGQPPCQSLPPLYRALGELDVEAYDFVMELSLLKGVPLFNLLTQLVKVEKEVESR